MRNSIRSLLGTPDRKLLVSNFFSLSIIQAGNYLVPLLILPFVLRIIGPEKFGLLTYAQTFVFYFTIIVNYSFDYTATREISEHREDKLKISRIFSSVLYCKLLLFAVATLVFIAVMFFIDQFKSNITVYVSTYLINVGFIFFPTWFFQGIQKLTLTAFFNFFAKLLFALVLIFLINEEDDFLIFSIGSSAAQVIVGLAAFLHALYKYQVKIVATSFYEIQRTLKGGLSIFFSNIVVSLYTNTNLLILGWYTSVLEFGYFSAALKVALAVQSLVILPLGMTLFPHIGKAMQRSAEEGTNLLKKYIKRVSLSVLLISVVIFIFAEEIIVLLFGESFLLASDYLKILAFLPLVSGINNMVSVQGLINLKKDKQYLYITLAIFAFSLPLNVILLPIFKGIGTSMILIFSEVIMALLGSFYLFRKTTKEKTQTI
jgi:PST family polysaccharide transporter